MSNKKVLKYTVKYQRRWFRKEYDVYETYTTTYYDICPYTFVSEESEYN